MLRKILFSILTFSFFVLNAQENKEIKVDAKVSDVTVFLKGAQVTRKANVQVPAGRTSIRFTKLSPYIDGQSVQVKLDASVMLLGVNHQNNYRDTVKLKEEFDVYAKQIKAIEDEIELEHISLEILTEEIDFLQENKKIGGSEKGIEYENLKRTTEYYGTRMADLAKKRFAVSKNINSLIEDKQALLKFIASAGHLNPEPTGEVILTVEAKTATNLPIELSYYVDNVAWYPTYDIRATDISQPIELVYKANIMQNTKETWENVNLKVSSINPNLGSIAPELQTYKLDYWTKPPKYDLERNNLSNTVSGMVRSQDGLPLMGVTVLIKGTSIGTSTDFDGNYSLAIPSGGGVLEFSSIGYKTLTRNISRGTINVVLEQDSSAIEDVVLVGYGPKRQVSSVTGSISTVQDNSSRKAAPLPVVQVENNTSVEFDIKTPYTIPSENKTTVVEMEHYALEADYEYISVPKVVSDAFLTANIPNWEQYNLLEGEANVFFENTFVGKTILDTRYTSDTLNVSLGRDRNVQVKREKAKDYKQTRFLSSKAEVTRNWTINVRNNKSQAISMTILDQIPVSTLSEIEVTPEELSGGILNKEDGEVKWDLNLAPSQRQELNLKYKVRYPKSKTLTVE